MKNHLPFNYIDKDKTDIIKGIAIIFMLIHHFFTYPMWFVHQYQYMDIDTANMFREPFKICVCIFAFLTGYFYVFAKKQTYQYSLRKITDLWLNYFIVFLLLMSVALMLGCWKITAKSFILESLSVENEIVNLAWYVKLYTITMLILPLYIILARKHILIAFLTGMLIPDFLIKGYNTLHILPDSYLTAYVNACAYFFIFSTGIIFAQYELFSKWFDPVFKNHISNKFLLFMINFSLVLFAFIGRYALPTLNYFTRFSADFIYAPLFVYGIINLISLVPNYRKVLKPLAILGKYSLVMWFFHSIFYDVCKEYTQPFLYISANPVVVVVWGTVLCFVCSFIISIPVNFLVKYKNKLLFKN